LKRTMATKERKTIAKGDESPAPELVLGGAEVEAALLEELELDVLEEEDVVGEDVVDPVLDDPVEDEPLVEVTDVVPEVVLTVEEVPLVVGALKAEVVVGEAVAPRSSNCSPKFDETPSSISMA